MFLSGSYSLRALRKTVVRIVFVLLPLLFAVPFAAAQALEPGGPADMGALPIGTSSSNFTFTFTATTPTTIQSVTIYEEGKVNADFTLASGATQTCSGTIQIEGSCNINVTFTPQKVGLRRGAIVILDSHGNIAFTQFLYGVGLGPQISFSPVSATVLAGLSGVTPTTFKPSSAVYDGSGNLYTFDYANGRLLKLDTSNHVTILGTFTGTMHSSLAINGAGTLYLTLPTGIQMISPSGVASALLTPGISITAPGGIAIDGAGFVYVTDSQGNRVARIAPDGSTASFISTAGQTLSSPFGLAVDHDFLYIADSGNGRIVEVAIATGVATALTSTNALNQPYGIAVDASGTVVAADAGGSDLVQISPTGTVSPVVPDAGVTIASTPLGVLVATTGDFVSSDDNLGLVFLTRGSNAQLIFPTPTKVGTPDGTDGFETMTVQNSGNQVIDFSSTAPTISDADFNLGATNSCPVNQTTSTPLAVAASCTYTFGFTPSVQGTDQATVSIRGTAVGTGALVTNVDTLIGTGIAPIDSLSVVASPSATTPGNPVGFTVTALQGTNPLTTFTGTVTFTMTDPSGVFLGGTSYTFTSADQGAHTFPANLGAVFNTPGQYTITAKYTVVSGTSNVVTVLYPSTTTLTSSSNPTPIGGQTTLTAVVTGVGTGITPTGTVTFEDGTTVVGTCTLVAGTCHITPSLPVGSGEVLTAIYSGDTNFSPSTSNIVNQTVSGFTAGLVLQSSVNPSAVGQQVTFTATEVPTSGQTGAPVPTGSVTITINNAVLCTTSLAGGKGSCNNTFTATGSYNMVATYTGDAFYAPSTSNLVVQIVNSQATPLITLSSSINPSVINQQVTFTTKLAPPAGLTATPTGTVTFSSNGTNLCTTTLINGTASCNQTYTAAGNYSIVATYSGDSNYVTTFATLTQVVTDKLTTVMTLNSSVNPSVPNQQVTFTAALNVPQGTTTFPAGPVIFTSAGTTICTATPVNLVATCNQTYTALGSYAVVATYNGDASYQPATANLTQVVKNKTDPIITLTSSLNPAQVNQQVTYTAKLAPSPGLTTTPIGAVTFTSNGTTICTAVVFSGVAVCNQTYTAPGSYPIVATYSGDANYNTIVSSTLTEVVAGLFNSTTTMSASPNPANLGANVTLSATVVATPGQAGAGQPTGKVTFFDGATPLVSCNLTGSGCSVTTTFSAVGPHSLTAQYAGDTSFNPSTSVPFTETINGFTATIVMASSVNPSTVNQQTTLSATVAAASGQTNPPAVSGTVSFYDGSTLLGMCTLVNGACTKGVSFSATGSHTLTAVYSGDAHYGSLTSATYTQVVTNLFSAQISMSATPNPVFLNTPVSLTATVASSGPAPSGVVTFLNGTSPLGSAAVVNGVATTTVSFSSVNTYSVTAVYSGDANYATVTSAPVNEVVEDFSFTLASATGGSMTVVGGHAATYTFTVSPLGGTTFPADISFTLSGFPSNSVYAFSPATVASGIGTTTITLTITPPAVARMEKPVLPGASHRELPIAFALLLLPFTLRLGSKRGRRPAALLLWMLMVAGVLGMTGCLSDAQSGYYGDTGQTYSLTATASSGALSHSDGLSLTRQ